MSLVASEFSAFVLLSEKFNLGRVKGGRHQLSFLLAQLRSTISPYPRLLRRCTRFRLSKANLINGLENEQGVAK